jgi:phosphoribosyl-ATP pyrophosphohydrolase
MGKSVKKTALIKAAKKPAPLKRAKKAAMTLPPTDSDVAVLDRLFAVVHSRRDADPATSHSARLLSRGPAKVAQKFGEEAVECVIEAVTGNRDALVAESADVLYHLLVVWVAAGVTPQEVWAELSRREGVSGIAEKAARPKPVIAALSPGTSKIP